MQTTVQGNSSLACGYLRQFACPLNLFVASGLAEHSQKETLNLVLQARPVRASC